MAFSCPNKSHPDWKKLVEQVGETKAYEMYIENNFDIPDSNTNIKNDIKFGNIKNITPSLNLSIFSINEIKPGTKIGSTGICNGTSHSCKEYLASMGYPVTEQSHLSMKVKSVWLGKYIYHYVAVTIINNQIYIYDMPQHEFLGNTSINDPLLDEGIMFNQKFKPRLIPLDVDSISSNYNVTYVDAAKILDNMLHSLSHETEFINNIDKPILDKYISSLKEQVKAHTNFSKIYDETSLSFKEIERVSNFIVNKIKIKTRGINHNIYLDKKYSKLKDRSNDSYEVITDIIYNLLDDLVPIRANLKHADNDNDLLYKLKRYLNDDNKNKLALDLSSTLLELYDNIKYLDNLLSNSYTYAGLIRNYLKLLRLDSNYNINNYSKDQMTVLRKFLNIDNNGNIMLGRHKSIKQLVGHYLKELDNFSLLGHNKTEIERQLLTYKSKYNKIKTVLHYLAVTNNDTDRLFKYISNEFNRRMSYIRAKRSNNVDELYQLNKKYEDLSEDYLDLNSSYNGDNQSEYQLNSPNKPRFRSDPKLDAHIEQILKTLGVELKSVTVIYDKNGDIVSATAKANLFRGIIEVINSEAEIDTLPEEAFHFIVRLMDKNGALFKALDKNIVSLPKYNEVLNSPYAQLYKNADGSIDLAAIREEAIGQVLAEELVRMWKAKELATEIKGTKPIDIIRRAIQRLWKHISSIFTKITVSEFNTLMLPFTEVATKTLNNEVLDITSPYSVSTEVELERIASSGSKLSYIAGLLHESSKQLKTKLRKADLTGNIGGYNNIYGSTAKLYTHTFVDYDKSRLLYGNLSQEEIDDTILHEEIHRYTTLLLTDHRIVEHYLLNSATNAEKQFVESIKLLYNIFKSSEYRDYDSSVINIEEFVAYGITDSDFMHVLDSIELNREYSFLYRFIQIIAELFSGRDKVTVLTSLQHSFNTLMTNHINIKEFMVEGISDDADIPSSQKGQPELFAIKKLDRKSTIDDVVTKFNDTTSEYDKVMVSAEEVGIKDLATDSSGKLERYRDKETGKVLRNRTTDIVHRKFIEKVGRLKASLINDYADNKLKAETGTKVHYAAQLVNINNILLDPEYKKYITLANSELKPTSVNDIIRLTGLTKEQIEVINLAVRDTIDKVVATQKNIDPKGKVIISAEQMIINLAKDKGGSLDLIAIYSNKSYSIVDYKSIFPTRDQVEVERDSKGNIIFTLVEEPFKEYKYESYDLQLTDYKNTLKEEYGLTDMVYADIVPIQVHLKLKDKSDMSEGSIYTDKIQYISAGKSNNELLGPKAVAGTKTGIASLDKILDIQRARLTVLNNDLERARGDKRDVIKAEIARIRKSIINITADKSIESTLSDIVSLIKFLRGDDLNGGALSAVSKSVNGLPDPLFLDLDELLRYKNTLEAYKNLSSFVQPMIQNLKGGTEEDKKKATELEKRIVRYIGHIATTLSIINERITDRVTELKDSINVKETNRYFNSGIGGQFTALSEVQHPIFKTMWRMLQKQQSKHMGKLNSFNAELKKHQAAVEEWAKANNISVDNVIDLIRDKNTLNMYSRISSNFWNLYNSAILKGDTKWIKDNFKLKDNYEEIYKARLERAKKRIESSIRPEEGILTEAQAKARRDKALKQWIDRNNLDPTANRDNWANKDILWLYAEIKPDVLDKNLSEQFAYISKHKPLLDFYEFVESFTKYANNIADKDLPRNFLPKIRRSFVEAIANGTLGGLKGLTDEILSTVSLNESDQAIGVIDPLTNKPIREIPIYYTNEILKSDGTLDANKHSKDIFKIMSLFAKSVYNYEVMEEIETDLEILKQSLMFNNEGELLKNSKGEYIRNMANEILKTFQMGQTPTVEAFEQFMDHYLYGVTIRDQGYQVGKVNSLKVVTSLKKITAWSGLAFRVITPMAAYAAIQSGMYAEATKGLWFNRENLSSVRKDNLNPEKAMINRAISKFFNARQDLGFERTANRMSVKNVTKYANSDTAFYTYRRVDESSDNLVTCSILKNWGIYTPPFDKTIPGSGEPRLVRMDALLKINPNAKSVYDSISYDKDKDEMFIDGLSEEIFIKIREAIKRAGSGIKGNMSQEDYYRYNGSLLMSAMMQFKSWMPGYIRERFKGISYDDYFNITEQGRVNAFFSNFSRMSKEEKRYFAEQYLKPEDVEKFINENIVSRASKIMVDLMTFGLKKYEFNEARARFLYEKFLEHEGLDEGDVNFESFLEMKRGQTRAMINELRWATLMGMTILGLGSSWGDDDDKALYTKYWVTRKLYSLLSRAHTELVFAYDPTQFINLVSNPLPLVGSLSRLVHGFNNGIDEIYQHTLGEVNKRDKTPFMYYWGGFIPGFIELRRLLELTPQDKQPTKVRF